MPILKEVKYLIRLMIYTETDNLSDLMSFKGLSMFGTVLVTTALAHVYIYKFS